VLDLDDMTYEELLRVAFEMGLLQDDEDKEYKIQTLKDSINEVWPW